MTTPYRTPGEVCPVKLSKWRAMPVLATKRYAEEPCPYCDIRRAFGCFGRFYAVRGVACSPPRRIGWPWERCDLPGVHHHLDCSECGMRWISMMRDPEKG